MLATTKTAERRYPYDQELFEEAISDATLESLLFPVEIGERTNVRLKSGFDTACWAYLPPHEIFIGKEIFEREAVRQDLTREQQKEYIINYYHHECGHALSTEKDMALIKRRLALIQETMVLRELPFHLWNLFEDAYIEERYRQETKRWFNWKTYEVVAMGPNPETLFFVLIQLEGDVVQARSLVDEWAPRCTDSAARDRIEKHFDTIVDFYKRACRVRNSLDLMPLLQEWLRLFPESKSTPKQPPGRGAGEKGEGMASGLPELAISILLGTDAKFAEEFVKGAVSVQAVMTAGPNAGGGGDPTQSKEDLESTKPIAQRGVLLKSTRNHIDMERVNRVALKFEKLFVAKVRHSQTTAPQKRLSARHYAVGRPFYRRKDIESKGPKTIFLEIDCSSSMGGFHIAEGRILVAALSQLARKGLVRGHVVLSGVKESGACYETHAFPMALSNIEKISAHCGAEGLEGTLISNLQYAREADHVFVYTDGQITDSAMDKEFLHSRGIFTWGLYAGSEAEFLTKLLLHFDKAVMRKTAEELVDAILTQLK